MQCQLFTGNHLVIKAFEDRPASQFFPARREAIGMFLPGHPDLREWTEHWLGDNDFVDLPAEPGVYECSIIAEWEGTYDEADLRLYVRDVKKVLDFPVIEATRTDMEWEEAFPEEAKRLNDEYERIGREAEEEDRLRATGLEGGEDGPESGDQREGSAGAPDSGDP